MNPNDNIKSENYEPANSFEDYTPQITVMPRLAFSFNLTEQSSFFAHYDILTQRPQDRLRAGPDTWYFFNENITSVKLFDMMGKEIRHYANPERKLAVLRETLKAGIYMVVVAADDKILGRKKLTIQ